MGLGGSHHDSLGQSSSIDSDSSRRFDAALFATLDELEKNKIDYALIGGVAAYAHARPRSTQDIDIFVRPEDADNLLKILEKSGFETTRVDESWLFKAFKDGVLIDIIFRSEMNLYFDEEMNRHALLQQYHGRTIRVVSPEDLIILKCAAHSEAGHHHWHDALAVLAQAKIDWDYLIHRARKAPRRLLALLIYAQSVDIWVPNAQIHRLFLTIFGDDVIPRPRAEEVKKDVYLQAKIKDALAESRDTGALDAEVLIQGDKVVVRGQASDEERKQAILGVVEKHSHGLEVENQIEVADWQAPKDIEAV